MSQHSNIRPLALQPPDAAIPIRPVGAADIAALCADCWAHHTVTRSRRLLQRIEAAQAQQRGAGIVALHPDNPAQIIGYGQLIGWSHCGEVSDLIVAQAFRSRGIGTAIIQYLVRHAQHLAMDCVDIGVAERNARALVLYRRLGFLDTYRLQLRLGEEKEPVIYLRLAFSGYVDYQSDEKEH